MGLDEIVWTPSGFGKASQVWISEIRKGLPSQVGISEIVWITEFRPQDSNMFRHMDKLSVGENTSSLIRTTLLYGASAILTK